MYIFIINKRAGGGKGERIYKQLKRSELFQSLNRKCFFTKGKKDAIAITKQLLLFKQPIQTIVVIGGDGTLHEVINGLDDANIPVSFIPGGSGNDFARGFGILKHPLEVLQAIVEGTDQREYYFGQYSFDYGREKYFVNCIGFGFDAEVVIRANQRWLRKLVNFFRIGRLLYVFALLQTLMTFKPFNVNVKIDGKVKTLERCWMVVVTNHPYFGGGMKAIPNAKIEGQFFPVLTVHSVSKWKVLFMFMTIFTGKHLNIKGVDLYEKVSCLTIKSKDRLPFQVDGELNYGQYCQVSKRTEAVMMQGTKSSHKMLLLKTVEK